MIPMIAMMMVMMMVIVTLMMMMIIMMTSGILIVRMVSHMRTPTQANHIEHVIDHTHK